MPHTPAYPPEYLFVLFDMDGYVHEFTITDRDKAMAAWEDDKSKAGTEYLHAFLYVKQTSGWGDHKHLHKHLLHSF